MKAYFSIFFLLIVTAVHCQSASHLLKTAYKQNSMELLNQFFVKWSQEVPAVTDDELFMLNDTLKQAYSVFSAFYKPQSIDSLGGSEWGNDIYRDVRYLIVQNVIKIYFSEKVYYTEEELDDYIVENINQNIKDDSLRQRMLTRTNGKLSETYIGLFGLKEIKRKLADSIMNFRPQINCNGKIPLYLNSHYDKILNDFLGEKHTPLGLGGIMNPAKAAGESEGRKKFLENYIRIWYGHWGGYWQLYSYPKAYAITFDKDMKYARVDFRMIYEGGEAFLKNDNGKWILISAERTWIE